MSQEGIPVYLKIQTEQIHLFDADGKRYMAADVNAVAEFRRTAQSEAHMKNYDILLKGGHVLDLEAGFDGVMDVVVKRSTIAAVEPDIPTEAAFRVFDVYGKYVVPGLIDLHAHFQPGTYWGIDADAIGSHSGVTTWVDAGSPGALTLPQFRQTAEALSEVRVYTFVNISYIGLIAQDYELANPEYSNLELLERVVNLNRDIVIGLKVRTGRSGGATSLEPLQRARLAADRLQLPIMMHISTAPPSLEVVLPYLKSGDIITHAFTGQSMKLVNDDGTLKPAAKEALERGVILDLGHGAGSFSFQSAEALVALGIFPHTISTDLHWLALYGPNLVEPLKGSAFGNSIDARSIMVHVKGSGEPEFNLLTCIDKLRLIGMPLAEALRAATSHPAKILGVEGELGTLKPGAKADVAVLEDVIGDYTFYDIHQNVRHSEQRLQHVMTLLDGQFWEPIRLPPPPPWVHFVDRA
jgi:dihydroorotase